MRRSPQLEVRHTMSRARMVGLNRRAGCIRVCAAAHFFRQARLPHTKGTRSHARSRAQQHRTSPASRETRKHHLTWDSARGFFFFDWASKLTAGRGDEDDSRWAEGRSIATSRHSSGHVSLAWDHDLPIRLERKPLHRARANYGQCSSGQAGAGAWLC